MNIKIISLKLDSLALFSDLEECWIEILKICVNGHKEDSCNYVNRSKQISR
jgi:hypothetical protein